MIVEMTRCKKSAKLRNGSKVEKIDIRFSDIRTERTKMSEINLENVKMENFEETEEYCREEDFTVKRIKIEPDEIENTEELNSSLEKNNNNNKITAIKMEKLKEKETIVEDIHMENIKIEPIEMEKFQEEDIFQQNESLDETRLSSNESNETRFLEVEEITEVDPVMIGINTKEVSDIKTEELLVDDMDIEDMMTVEEIVEIVEVLEIVMMEVVKPDEKHSDKRTLQNSSSKRKSGKYRTSGRRLSQTKASRERFVFQILCIQLVQLLLLSGPRLENSNYFCFCKV